MSIPLPMLWQARLKPIKKWGLLFLFSGGVFVVVCATLRCILIVTVSFPICCSYRTPTDCFPPRTPRTVHSSPDHGLFVRHSSPSSPPTCLWFSRSSSYGWGPSLVLFLLRSDHPRSSPMRHRKKYARSGPVATKAGGVADPLQHTQSPISPSTRVKSAW